MVALALILYATRCEWQRNILNTFNRFYEGHIFSKTGIKIEKNPSVIY